MDEKRKRNIGIFQVLLCSAMWSMGGIFIKLIPWNSFAIAGLRSLLAGSVAFIYLRSTGRSLAVNKRTLISGAALGTTMMLFCLANKLTTAANAIVLQFTSPMFIMVISALFFGKRFSRADIITVVITMAGISLFFLDQLSGGGVWGNFVAIFSGVTFACYYISLGACPENERLSAIVIANALTFLVGVPFMIATRPVFTSASVLYILILGVLQLGIPYVLLAKGSEYCPPLTCSLLGALEPLLNPVWVFIFNGEAPGVFALIGGAAVVVTISLWCVYNDKKAKAETT